TSQQRSTLQPRALSVITGTDDGGRSQGELNNPAHLRAHMPTDVAVQTPVEQSLQRLEIANTDRQQALVQSQQQEMDNRVREGSAMRIG
ncbi:XVIPCD domain-containing protein, partial [Xanthomonas campestris]|uniref:XVIPCD domain-containing protein n=1 Tax=Xanthomonas campestris TaxID=339 RepID=UPI0032E48662